MSKISDLLRAAHGSNYIIALASFDCRADEIEDKYQKALDDGVYRADDMLAFGRSPEQWAADEAYGEICREILKRWMQAITRDQMIAMLNALSAVDLPATVVYLPGETMTVSMLMHEWNRANPDADPIYVNPDYLP